MLTTSLTNQIDLSPSFSYQCCPKSLKPVTKAEDVSSETFEILEEILSELKIKLLKTQKTSHAIKEVSIYDCAPRTLRVCTFVVCLLAQMGQVFV